MFNTGSTTVGMPNWEEETGQEVVSQQDALIWSVNSLFDSFSFLINYVIYIPRQTQLLARRFTPFYTSTRPTGLPSSGEVTISILHASYPATTCSDCVPIRTPRISVPEISQTSVAYIRWR
jgi:hypothetical protein